MSASLITEVVSDVLQEPVTVRSAAVFVHSKVLTIYLVSQFFSTHNF